MRYVFSSSTSYLENFRQKKNGDTGGGMRKKDSKLLQKTPLAPVLNFLQKSHW
jgi:hypothetical protein